MKFYPYEKGGGKGLAMLKRGGGVRVEQVLGWFFRGSCKF